MTANPAAPLSVEDLGIVQAVAKAIVARGLTTPAILFLEMAKPFSRIGFQIYTFSAPILKMVALPGTAHRLMELMEDRANVERLIEEIERLEAEQKPPAADASSPRRRSD